MIDAKNINQEQLKKLLRYDPDTGIFTWLVRRGTVCAGKTAGCVNGSGYVVIGVFGVLYQAHRLVWLYMTGQWPKEHIDHINGIRNDNRWENLREADQSTNMQNQREAMRDNKVGLLGVYKPRDRRKFRAEIRLKGKRYFIGYYSTPELAYAAYLKAKRRMHAGCTI